MISVIERIDTEQITKLDFFHRQIKCLRGLLHKINIYVLSSFGMSSFTIVLDRKSTCLNSSHHA